jgi:hypothetical protein
MLHYEALRQSTHEHRLHHEAEAETERLALQARGGRLRRTRRLPLAREIDGHVIQRPGQVVVTVWPRR